MLVVLSVIRSFGGWVGKFDEGIHIATSLRVHRGDYRDMRGVPSLVCLLRCVFKHECV